MNSRQRAMCLGLAAVCWLGTGNSLPLQAAEGPTAEPPKEEVRRVQQLKPDRLISESTLLYASTPDFTRARKFFERTAFNSILNEDEFQPLITTAFGKMRDTYVKGDGTRSEAEVQRRNAEVDLLLKLAPFMDGQVALAVEGDEASLAALARGTLPPFILVASVGGADAGDRQRQMVEILDRYRANLIIDSRYTEIDLPDGAYPVQGLDNPSLNLYETWAFVENLFVYGQGRTASKKGMVEDAIERFKKGGAGTLNTQKTYQDAYKAVGRDEGRGEALVYIQVDFRSSLNLFLNTMSEDSPAHGILASYQATGPSLALGMYIADGEKAAIREKFLFNTPAGNKPKNTEPCKAVTARFASDEAILYGAESYSMADLIQRLRAKVNQRTERLQRNKPKDQPEAPVEDETLEQKIVQLLDLTEQEQDLFKGELGAFVTYAPSPEFRSNPGLEMLNSFQFVIALEVNSETADWETALDRLAKKITERTGQKYERKTYEGAVVHYVQGAQPDGEAPATARGGIFANTAANAKAVKGPPTAQFFTAFARVELPDVKKRYVLVSESLLALEKAIKQANRSNSLSDDIRFRDLLKSFRDTRYELGYVDMSRLLDAYTGIKPTLIRSGAVSRDKLNQLPSVESLQKHLTPMVWSWATLPDSDNLLMECISPTGILPLLGVTGGVAWPYYNENVKREISQQTTDRFRQIMVGLQLYAADYDRLPRRLSELYSSRYIPNLNVFRSPFNRNGLVEKKEDAGREKEMLEINDPAYTNLVYVPGRTLNDLSRQIILYEKEPTRLEKSDTGRLLHHVLQIDGRVLALTKPSIERRLAGKLDFVSSNTGGEKKPAAGKPGAAPAARTRPAQPPKR